MTKSSKVEQFEITFNSELAVYQEGDTVSGQVHLEIKEDLKLKAIKLEVCGLAIVNWSGATIKKDNQDTGEITSKGDSDKEQYFQKKITLLEKDSALLDKGDKLTAGSYTWPWECQLPTELPCSFEGKFGCIRYVVKTSVERPWKRNIVSLRAFTVLAGLDLNFIPEAVNKLELCRYKELGRACCKAGNVVIDYSVGSSGFVPGEDILIHGAIQNESAENVAMSKAVLYMVVEYTANKRRRLERQPLTSVEKGEVLPGDVDVWHEKLHVPPVPPTGLNRCMLIDINYELQFTVSFEGKYSPVIFTKDLYIGTVPINDKVLIAQHAKGKDSPFILGGAVMEGRGYIMSAENFPPKESMVLGGAAMEDKALYQYHAPLAIKPTGHALGDGSRQAGSAMSLTRIIAEASLLPQTVQPSAPLIGQDEQHTLTQDSAEMEALIARELVMERPPPFAPGHFGDVNIKENQSAPNPDANPGHHDQLANAATGDQDNAAETNIISTVQPALIPSAPGLYPTLARSWFGAVNIHDDQDENTDTPSASTKHERFAPVYPYYNTIKPTPNSSPPVSKS